jgi:pimeloyl-ACP methyl ester carboxylesterase
MSRSSSKPNQRRPHTPDIAGSWLLKALAAVIVVALACTYLTLCLVFSWSEWQLVLHPVRTSLTESSQVPLIHFDPGDSGQPQLTSVWYAAPPESHYKDLTILFLPGGDGSLASFATTQAALQQLGINVFAFDYRGYGESATVHPTEERMTEDTEAAWRYLTQTRKISPSTIVPYGVGVGASLATRLTQAHPEIPGIMLDSPYADLREGVRKDPRFRFLPVSLLFHEDFPLAEPLAQVKKPKLLFVREPSSEPASYLSAADPKRIVLLKADDVPGFDQSITRFLDEYVLVPSAAPASTKPR